METATHAHKRATFEALYREHQLSVLAYCTRPVPIQWAVRAGTLAPAGVSAYLRPEAGGR